MNGKVVGIVASNPMYRRHCRLQGGAQAGPFRRTLRYVQYSAYLFCGHPGLHGGTGVRSQCGLREGVRARYIGLQVTVPVFTVIVRKCYGMAGGGAIDRRGLNFKIAWPSAEWGSLPLEGGVKAAYRREIESAADPAQREKEIEAELRQVDITVSHCGSICGRRSHRSARDTPLFVPVHRCCPDTARNTARA